MKYNGAELLMKLLEQQGIEYIAGIPGGANLPIYNALYKSSIKHILCKHEQGAGFLAHGMARSTGKTAVCFATSGPGATNTITAIADAKLDSIPVIFITGQVSSSYIGTDAFQEVDTYGITIPITKHNFLVRSASELLEIIPEAFTLANSGRPGPVVIDIPKDVQLQAIEVEELPQIGIKISVSTPPLKDFEKGAKLIEKSSKPVIYAGGGLIHSDASRELLSFAEKSNIPVTTTLMGLGSFPSKHPLFIGMLGMHAARYTNYILEECDLLITLGARFDDRATGNVKKFCPNATILHLDIDEAEIDKNKKSDHFIIGDLKESLETLTNIISSNKREHWLKEVNDKRLQFPLLMPAEKDFFKPLNIISKVAKLLPDDAIITTDVGQHQMWVAQVYPFNIPRTMLTSGGLGTMGFGMPAAIGAALANRDKKVICFSGDGSILMNIQELKTLSELDLDVKIIIFNNGHLGMVRQQQELFYSQNYIASKFDSSPDFAKISEGFGMKGVKLDPSVNPYPVLMDLFESKKPILIDVPIHFEENVFPIVPPGAANKDMLGGEFNDR